MAVKELSSINTSGELVVVNLGGTTPGHKLLTSAEIGTKLQVLENTLTAPKTTLEAEGHVPAVILEVENGGVASTVETTYDNGTTTHAVSTIQWLAAQNEADWTLSNKDTGTIETMFRILNGGVATIGTATEQNQIATLKDIANVPHYFDIQDANTANINTLRTEGRYIVGSGSTNRPSHTQGGIVEVSTDELNNELYQVFHSTDSFKSYERHSDGASSWDAWVETPISADLGFVTYNITKKADKTSLPTIFSGDVEPLNTLGKDLDWYHRFEHGSSSTTDLYTGISLQNFYPDGFLLMAVQDGDAIDIAPKNNLVFVDVADNSTLPVEDLKLTLDANVIPLTIVSNTAGSVVASYSQTWDAVMENVTTSTTFKLTATVGVQTDKEYDYQKHNGEWYKVDFLNVDEINELIRSYDVTIEMNTAGNKPTKAECITAFNQLPHADYTKDDSYHIMSTNKDRMNFVKYLANGSTDADNYTVGLFFVQELSLAT